jgi:hypothetical protein
LVKSLYWKKIFAVDPNHFLQLLKKSGPLEEFDYQLLKEIQLNFPYVHLAHGLAAKYEFEKNGGKHGPSLAWAALTSPDRIRLKSWIERPSELSEAKVGQVDSPEAKSDTGEVDSISEPNQSRSDNDQEMKDEPIRVEKKRRSLPKDDLIESIKKKEKREILDSKKKEQIDLIREFNKKDFKLAAIREIEANQPTENLADASTRLNDNLVSETFARILIRQGKNETAIEIYEKLALKFPEKRTYFADLIEKLKE